MYTDIFLSFMIYSFLGWCCESIYCSFGRGEWINRGFLNGPFCPVYGFGALFTLYFLQFFPQTAICIFLGGMIVTSLLEYITGWLMEKIFHAKWWDYSNRKFHIHGRVCLLNSTLFGLLCLFLCLDLQPSISNLLSSYSEDFKFGFLIAFLIYFLSDLTVSVWSALGLNIRLKYMEELREQILTKYTEFGEKLDIVQLENWLKTRNLQEELMDKMHQKEYNIGFFQRRLIRAFPEMSSKKSPALMKQIQKNLTKREKKNGFSFHFINLSSRKK